MFFVCERGQWQSGFMELLYHIRWHVQKHFAYFSTLYIVLVQKLRKGNGNSNVNWKRTVDLETKQKEGSSSINWLSFIGLSGTFTSWCEVKEHASLKTFPVLLGWATVSPPPTTRVAGDNGGGGKVTLYSDLPEWGSSAETVLLSGRNPKQTDFEDPRTMLALSSWAQVNKHVALAQRWGL